ncbi:hypothetical protein SOW02_10160 [Pectobacterium actinidiae]|nr:hypothetical protein [Pectobacterium actinidiae]MDY4315299.1 hypothetical protein [Pectobacterium actinidiae]
MQYYEPPKGGFFVPEKGEVAAKWQQSGSTDLGMKKAAKNLAAFVNPD